MKVLLIWNEVPENLRVYMLDVNKEDYEKMRICHSKLIGLSGYTKQQDDALDWLSNFLLDKKNEVIYENNDNQVICDITNINANALIVSGQIL
jgi:hypothetical protein